MYANQMIFDKLIIFCILLFILAIKTGSSLKCYVCNEADYIYIKPLFKRELAENVKVEPTLITKLSQSMSSSSVTEKEFNNDCTPQWETTSAQLIQQVNNSITSGQNTSIGQQFTTIQQEIENQTEITTNNTLVSDLKLEKILTDASIDKNTSGMVEDVKDCRSQSTNFFPQRQCYDALPSFIIKPGESRALFDWQCVLIAINANGERKYLRGCKQKHQSCDILAKNLAFNEGHKVDECFHCTNDLCNDNTLLTRKNKSPKTPIQKVLVVKANHSCIISKIGILSLLTGVFVLRSF